MYTCFVSAPAGVNLTRIKKILLERDIEIIHPAEAQTLGESISEKISKKISRSDIFLAVFDHKLENSNTFFELGLAVGYKKEIIILTPPNFYLPPDLSGFLTLRVTQGNLDALGFSLDQMLKATLKKPKKRGRKTYKDHRKRSRPISNKMSELRDELNGLDHRTAENTLVRFVEDLLKECGISVIKQSASHETGADFAIWSDGLEHILGNPILIQIKRTIKTDSQAVKITDQILNFICNSNSKSAIVLYLAGPPSDQVQRLTKKFNILFFRLEDIVDQLQNNNFVDIIRNRRNLIAHGGID